MVNSIWEYLLEFPDWVELGKHILKNDIDPLLVITINEYPDVDELVELIIKQNPNICISLYCDSSQQNIQMQKFMIKVAEQLDKNNFSALAFLNVL